MKRKSAKYLEGQGTEVVTLHFLSFYGFCQKKVIFYNITEYPELALG